jgi:hypothetical protein
MPIMRLLLFITGDLRIFSFLNMPHGLCGLRGNNGFLRPLLTCRCPAGVELVLRQSFADDVAVGHHTDQTIILPDRNGADVVIAHQFSKLG